MDQPATTAEPLPPAADVPPPAVVPPAPVARYESPGDALRVVVTVVILVVCIFLFIRTFAVEPFGVPTGSMAPALVGNHRETLCPRCGYPVVIGEPSNGDRSPDATCPNCGKHGIDLSPTWEIPGDRLMVDKNVFNVRSPRRWEVAVFRCPVDLSKPYVKRMIGLPGEAVQLIGGDVFINGQLQRKTLAHLREMRVPVFDLAFAPLATWQPRWHVEPVADDPNFPAAANDTPSKPVDETILRTDGLVLDASGKRPSLGLTYRHWNLDDKQEGPITDWLAYNASQRRRPAPVHDFLFTCDLEVTAGSGRFACRLGDGLDSVRAEFPIGAAAGEGVQLAADRGGTPPLQSGFKLEVGKTYRLEFAFVDRRAMLAIDGVEPFGPLDLPAPPDVYPQRGQVTRPLQLGVRGVAVAVRNVKLWRDIHYRGDGGDEVNGTKTPYQLAADEFFVLGDNSANSHDSRAWKIPGVPERDFIGKPFLIHQPLKAGHVTVNGGAKAFQTVDWDRLRWVR
ncbi:S26 family signal peptidase [Limnoglobus roseus]|uniref:Signal peptidase I n=1 Tax=Limnoglobus roseus TaxID=2598579 RepID=A0A5C1ABA4_9BACT|nr:S26 family signal peptidase [Limnoglobus roseus]QEL14414.1 S26 family signal peptidase [Limnoglobus roseus]